MSSIPDLFRPGITCAMLRWLLERGQCSSAEFRDKRVEMGGTPNGTHSFDRYFCDKRPHWRNHYVPPGGPHKLIERTNNKRTLTWVGSEGATFLQRARAWVARLDERAYRSFVASAGVAYTDRFTKHSETVWWLCVRHESPAVWCSQMESSVLESFVVATERMMLDAEPCDVDHLVAWATAARDEDKRRSLSLSTSAA